jgi:glycosyltransferase involved in cell wall biosynthesis
MSKHCDLTVLYGSAGAHMGDVNEMDDPIVREQLPGVRFITVSPPPIARWLNAANRRGWLTYTFYLAYRAWHAEAGRIARALVRESEFDVIHYLGPIGYREPGTLWKLDLPYIWGPIGGAPNLSTSLAAALPPLGRLKLGFRAIANWLQLRCSLRVQRALHRADILLTATSENQSIFERVLGVHSHYLPENGVIGEVRLDTSKFESMTRIRLIWIGTIEARKALRFLIDAFARMRSSACFEMHVVGDGPLRAKLQKDIAAMGMSDRFVWHGQVHRSTVQHLLNGAHLHVITSVSEGNPTTLWEAMACGVPTLSIDHCGMRDTIRDQAGLKVPIGPYDTVVQGFADHLDALAEAPYRLREMADRVVQDADCFHWRHRPAFWLARYEEAKAVRALRRGAHRQDATQ